MSSMTHDPEAQRTDARESARARLKHLLAQRQGQAPPTYPASSTQQRAWFLSQLQPDSAFYNVPVALRLTGPLRLGALRRAFDEVVRRHEALRTTFVTADGDLVQWVSQPAPVPVPLIDLSGLPVDQRERAMHQLAEVEARAPFDLSRGPLLRVRVLRIAAQDHALLVTVHHSIADGLSMDLLIREVTAAYLGTGLLEPPAAQFGEHAAWERTWLTQSPSAQAERTYWLNQLSGLTTLELPTDRPRPAVQTFVGKRRAFTVPREIADAMRQLAQAGNATSFMAWHALFVALLRKTTGQDDIALGVPIANREHPRAERVIGFFANTLVFRTQAGGDPTFAELLARVKATALDAFANQRYPFERLVEALQPERSLSRTPLFQVAFAMQPASMVATLPNLSELRMQRFQTDTNTARFDLMLDLSETAGGMLCVFEHSTDLFDDATIERMFGHLCTLAHEVAATPDRPLSTLTMLTEREQAQLRAWNDSAVDYGAAGESTLVALLDAQAERTPDAEAVRLPAANGSHALTYRQLHQRANQLAHHLISLGVRPESRVGVMLHRSLDLVVALVGILKAGAAYVPLDPEYPASRLAFMAQDAQADVILTSRDLASTRPETQTPWVELDADWSSIAQQPDIAPAVALTPDHLAYIIYTSGSTGQPKGAMNAHRGIVNRLLWMQAQYQLTPEDRVLQKTPFSFDVSVWEFFWPLLNGASLVMAEPGGHRDPAYLTRTIQAEAITIMHFVPSMLDAFLQADDVEGCISLRHVMCSGEALPKAYVERYQRRLSAPLHNLYGPTEAAVDVSHWTCPVNDPDPVIPIGRPIANLRLHVLDDAMQPVPVGVIGELYLGGIGVGRGYWSRAALTAEKFVPDPFSTQPGARLYRTGDLARWHVDGSVEYVGRADFQVKLRGLRIELGEVESALRTLPAIRDAAVLLREDTPGDQRLVAYLVPDGSPPAWAEVRAILQRTLPDYMVPTAFVYVPALALSPNGKVDRRALPVPDAAAATAGIGDAPPRSPIEELICDIWQRVLGLERVGIHDNFFALGGHSLMATQVLSRLRATLGMELPVRVMFDAPTVAELAAHVASAQDMTGASQASLQSPIQPVMPRPDTLPLSFAQQRMWFLERLHPGRGYYNLPAAMRLTGPLDVAHLRTSIQSLVQRHESLRTRFIAPNGEPCQVIDAVCEVDLPLIDFTALPKSQRDDAAQHLLGQMSALPFDLEHGPLLRTALVQLSDDEHIFLFTTHHIISDGWSQGVMMREIAMLYAARTSGDVPGLPDLPIQYADFALWQREWLGSEHGGRAHLEYWKTRLADVPPLELSGTRHRPAAPTHKGGHVRLALPEALGKAIHTLCRQTGTTPFMVLMAAYKLLLHRYSGQNDFVVGTSIANRNRSELESLVGFFVNALCLRSDLSQTPTFRALLEQVRHESLEAYAHQDIPFEQVVDALNLPRDISRSPVFQTFFVLQNAPQGMPEVGDLSARLIPLDSASAKFDLLLAMEVRGDYFSANLEYSRDLFDDAFAEQMAGHFVRVLEAVTSTPDLLLSAVPLLTQQEQDQLRAWNDSAVDYGAEGEQTLVALLEAQLERTPDAVAVKLADADGQDTLTYRQLHQRANQLAHHLIGLGVRPESRVGVMLHRSVDLVVALLGILKAGAAYVPLDPDYPSARLAFMLQDARADVIVSHSSFAASQPVGDAKFAAHWIELDTDAIDIAKQPDAALNVVLTPDHLAYVIYTSGSTGQPKGAMNTHRAIVNRLLWMQEQYQLTPDDRVLQKTPFSFDVSVWEFFWPLLTGARLIMARPGGHRDSNYLTQTIRNDAITTVHFVPSMLDLFLQADDVETCSSLRHVICSGEALPKAYVQRFQHRLGAQLHNLYGPTEAAVDVSHWTCPVDDPDPVIPIGRPIANLRLHVLDAALQPLPVGVIGELYLAGVGVGRGYVDRPGLTAEKFLPDPFSASPGARMYRAGDLARWRADGSVEYIGRADFQVKLRGLRIELGEIETVLRAQPSLRDACVIVREDTLGDQRLVAYAIPASDTPPVLAELRERLQHVLPDYMVPAAFVFLPALPLSANGKIDRRALPAPDTARPAVGNDFVAPQGALEARLTEIWCDVLKLERVGTQDNFFDLGGNSLLIAKTHSRVQAELAPNITLVEFFQHPTIFALATHIARTQPAPEQEQRASLPTHNVPTHGVLTPGAIAIIGMAGRFPGAPNIEAFWDLLCEGCEGIHFFSEQELRETGVPDHVLERETYVRARGVLEDAEMFDAAFFGFSAVDAEVLDPQHRVFLECAWEALEDAGLDPATADKRVGVYASAGLSSHLLHLFAHNPGLIETVGEFQTMISNDKDYLATRISYKLNLTGPSINVQTACSSSLVGVHLACQSLRAGECEVALAGGVSISVPQTRGYMFQPGGISSPDGHCRAFDAAANGTVSGNGVGVVVLKPLEAALKDGDAIYAVIRGSAINNDGAGKVGYTAPSVGGQARALQQALAVAEVPADTIAYIETHGTGTALGDPIELTALSQAYPTDKNQRPPIAIGSVKTNVGHLDAAAGVAGLIKTALMVQHGQIAPSLHFSAPNPQFNFARSGFEVSTALHEWPGHNTPRRAGVSSFGIGGTNAHVILEQAPQVAPRTSSDAKPELLLISARTPTALAAAIHRLGQRLLEAPELVLADVAYTLRSGRRAFAHRRALVCTSTSDAARQLSADDSHLLSSMEVPQHPATVAFMFTGQGAQYIGMARQMYARELVFREVVDICAALLEPELGLDIRSLIFDAEADSTRLDETRYTQPVLFTIEYALARWWQSMGVRPSALLGHSIGEWVAACLAGVFSLEDALRLVALRGRLAQRTSEGAMLSVNVTEDALAPYLSEQVSLAASNAPDLHVIAGDVEALAATRERLQAAGVATRPLHTTRAFHSHLMDEIVPEFVAAVRKVRRHAPNLPCMSNLTGTWLTAEDAQSPEYWGRQLRERVRFADNVHALLETPGLLLLEVGPGRTLATLARHNAGPTRAGHVLASLPHPNDTADDQAHCLDTLGRLWMHGLPIVWPYPVDQRIVRLPTYPFERMRYFTLPNAAGAAKVAKPESTVAMPDAQVQPSPAPVEPLAQHSRPALMTPYTPCSDDLERLIAGLWEQHLGIAPIGIHDDFFELGGHSLLAVRIIGRLRETLPVELPLEQVFAASTIAQLAGVVRDALIEKLDALTDEEARLLL